MVSMGLRVIVRNEPRVVVSSSLLPRGLNIHLPSFNQAFPKARRPQLPHLLSTDRTTWGAASGQSAHDPFPRSFTEPNLSQGIGPRHEISCGSNTGTLVNVLDPVARLHFA